MQFEEPLKALEEEGVHLKILCEKLFESYSHQELQPLLKEIQYNIIL